MASRSGGNAPLEVRADPAATLDALDLCERGEITARSIRVLHANLPRHIAEREIAVALRLLNWNASQARIDVKR